MKGRLEERLYLLFKQNADRLLFLLVSRCYEKSSLLITSNRATS